METWDSVWRQMEYHGLVSSYVLCLRHLKQ